MKDREKMNYDMNQRKKQDKIVLFFLLILIYGVMQLLGITCPIKFVTGVSCAGCGMTRAWISFLWRRNLSMAFAYHPLFWTIPIAIVIYFLRKKIPGKVYRSLTWIFILMMMLVYFYRMVFQTGDVVVFQPWNCLPCRLFYFLKNIL